MKKFLFVLIALLVVVSVIAGCGPGATPTAPPASPSPKPASPAPQPSPTVNKYGGTIRSLEGGGPVAPIGYPPETLGPSGVTPQITLQTLLKEMLDGSIRPNLAAAYKVDTSKESPSITFNLQKDVKFHDGTVFNAAAVKWNLENLRKQPAYASTHSNWKSIDVIDDMTLKISLNTWQNGVIRGFGDTQSYQISPTAFDKNGLEWARINMVGTGPFKQDKYQRDVTLTGVKNPDYWEKGKPFADRYEFIFVADEMTRVASFQSGAAEIVNIGQNGRVAADLQKAGYIIKAQYLGPMFLAGDSVNTDSPWSNVKVRQALEYAIDKEGIVKGLSFGYWKVANQFSTDVSKAYDPTIVPRKYDPAKAKALLAEAGYPQGFKTTFIAGPLFLNRDAALSIQQQMAAVGIQAEIQFPDFAKWSEINSNPPPKNSVLFSSINEWGNQNVTFNYFLGTPGAILKGILRPDGYKELLDQSKATPEQDPVLLKKIENIIFDNALFSPIYSGSLMWAMSPKLQDHGASTRGQANWFEPQNAWLQK